VSSPNGKSWSKERLEGVYTDFQTDHPEQVSNLVTPVVSKPLHQNSIARAVVVLGAAGCLALVGWIAMNGNSKSNNIATETTPVSIEDADGNSEGWKAAATQGTANGLPVDVPAKTPTPTATPTVKPAPVTPVKVTPVKATPTPVVKANPTPVKPQVIYKTVYRTLPAPARSTPKPTPIAISKPPDPLKVMPPRVTIAKVPPKSFIAIGGAGNRQARSPTVRTRRKPLASENVLLANKSNSKIKRDTLVPGTSVVGHLLSPMQSNSGTQSSPTAIAMKVAIDQPLRMMGGGQVPSGAMVIFAATVNPQNGAIAAVSGDAWHNGKTISIPQGAISIQAANKQPLIAASFRPNAGDLARADVNNALLGAAGQLGEELTRSTASVNVGNGSTIIQQTNNPNFYGAVLKGGFQTWATDQRQRTQTQASQILATQPIQYLPQGTAVTLTVDSPAQITITQ
jgi:hypothetical protein